MFHSQPLSNQTITGRQSNLTVTDEFLDLNEQQRAFSQSYVDTLDATKAAAMAGYTHPNTQGPRLLKHPRVKAVIKQAMADASATIGIDAQWLLKELVDAVLVAKASVKPKLNSKTGKPIKDDEGNPVFTRNDAALLKALELIGKYLGAFKDTVEVQSSNSDYQQRLEDVKAEVLSRYGNGRANAA